jgi:hypothetical protein
MPQIELKDLNCSLSTESYLEDLTDEAVNILGGTLEGAIALVANGAKITLARAEEYRAFIETTLGNLPTVENYGANYTVFYTTSLANSAHGYLGFQTFSTGEVNHT